MAAQMEGIDGDLDVAARLGKKLKGSWSVAAKTEGIGGCDEALEWMAGQVR